MTVLGYQSDQARAPGRRLLSAQQCMAHRIRAAGTISAMSSGDCLFCAIVHGELPSYQVYEDDMHIVLLDAHPVNPGHVLVVSRAHVESFYDLDEEPYTRLMLLIRHMARVIHAAFAPAQEVMETSGVGNRHVHVHVLPVYGLYDRVPQDVMEHMTAHPSAEELKQALRRLRAYMDAH
jgi:histidine triad (HIT) family protein